MKYFFLFFSFFLFSSAISQNKKIADSLGVVLKNNDLSKKEISKLLSLRAYYHQNIDSSRFLAKESLRISVEINAPLLQAGAWEEISHVERRLGNNSLSLQASLKALQIFESLGLVERQAASYGQLASNSISDNDYKSAIFYLKKARRIYQNSDKFGNEILTILNLGEAYRLAGHLDSATTCFKETLRRNEILKNEIVQGYSMGNLGMVYSVKNELVSAKINLNDAIDILSPLGDPYSTSIYLAELGSVYIKEGNYKVGERNILEAMNLAKKFGLKEQISDFASQLSSLYENKGMYAKALDYQRLNQVYKDSLVSKASIQKIEQLKSGYEISKRETEIDLLNTINSNQKNMVFILGAGVLLLLLFSYLLFRGNSIIKRANNELSIQKKIIMDREQEKALLLKELNHRVKNNLQMISSLLSLQSRELKGHPAQEAIMAGKNRVEALSLVHRKLYQEGLETKIMIKEYIEELVLGLFHGYNANFEPVLKIEDSSLTVNVAVPIALIINEMVVNALKYAYVGIVDPFLEVKVQLNSDILEIDITDNGIGFSTEEGEKNNSFGIKLISSLIDQLDGAIEKLTEKGTHWRMRIKVI